MGIKFNPLIFSGLDFTGGGGTIRPGTPIVGADPNAVLVTDGSSNLADIVLTDHQVLLGVTGSAPIATSSPTLANLNLTPSASIDLTGTGTLAIGTGNANIINIGNSGATINIQGDTIYQNVTNLNVKDKNITVNSGGSVGSASNAGINVEENSVITAYIDTTADRTGWELKAPSTAGVVTFTPGSSGFTINQGSHNPVTIGTANGLSLSTQALSLAAASTSTTGALTSTDWNTFNTAASSVTSATSLAIPNTIVLRDGANNFNISAISDTAASIAFDVDSRSITDTTSISSIDANLRKLYDSSGFVTTFDWSSGAKFPALTATTVPYLNSSKNLTSSSVTPTQLGYLSGATGTTGTGNLSFSASPTFTGTISAAALTLSTPLNKNYGGTGVNGSTFTQGGVYFGDVSGNFAQDSGNLKFDTSNNRLSIGGHLSTAALGITVTGASDVGFDLTTSASNTAMQVTNQGAQILAQFTNATNSATQGASFGGAFSRGTTTARTAVQAGDYVTSFTGQSYNGSSFGPGFNAAVVVIATENQTSTHNGGQLVFATTPNGSLAPVAGLTIGQDQSVTLPHYTTNGFVKFSGASGLLAVDTNTYLTGNQSITLSGDVTGSGTTAITTTLATVNANTGSFGSSTAIPNFTVNGKGLITAAGTNAVIAPAGTLTGTTLNSTVVTSSLTSVGTITSGTWTGTAVAATSGGTGLSTYTTGDVLYSSATNTLSKLGIGTTGQALTVSGGIPAWATITNNFTVDTFSGNSSTTAFTLSGTPGTVNNTWVVIGGVTQQKSSYTVVGTTLTFGVAPPTGTSNIEVTYGTSVSTGTPADGSVTYAKLAASTEVDNGNSGTSKTISFLASDGQKLTANGNCTLTFTNTHAGSAYILRIVHDATSTQYTFVWPTNTKWAGGTAPTLSATNGAIDVISIYYDGTNYYMSAGLAFS